MKRPHRHLAWLLLVLLPWLVYAPVRGFGFVSFDDPGYVEANERVLAGPTADNVAWAFSTFSMSNWHPLSWLSLMLDARLFGPGPSGFHTMNVWLHVANGLLLFAALRLLTGAHWKSALVALLFAVHPLHVESVAWVSARKDVLSTCFGMLALYAWVRHVKCPSRGIYALALAAFACSLMSKQMLVTLPFLMLVLDGWPLGRLERSPRRCLLEKLPFLALAAAAAVVVYVAQQEGGAVQDFEKIPLGWRTANAVVAYALYIVKTLWPSGLAVFYPHPDGPIPLTSVAASLGLLILVSAGALALRRRHPYFLTGWLWFLGTLVPVIGLVQVGAQSMADRYTYVPIVGLFIALVWLVPAVLPGSPWRRRVLAMSSLVVLSAATVAARVQTRTWESSFTLYAQAIAVTEGNYRAHNNLGAALGAAGRTEEAIEHLRLAVESRPRYASAHDNLGMALTLAGRAQEGIPHFRSALEIDPGLTNAMVNWGIALEGLRRLDAALERFERAHEMAPGDERVRMLLALAHNNLGVQRMREGNAGEAARHYRAALALRPDLEEARRNLRRVGGG